MLDTSLYGIELSHQLTEIFSTTTDTPYQNLNTSYKTNLQVTTTPHTLPNSTSDKPPLTPNRRRR